MSINIYEVSTFIAGDDYDVVKYYLEFPSKEDIISILPNRIYDESIVDSLYQDLLDEYNNGCTDAEFKDWVDDVMRTVYIRTIEVQDNRSITGVLNLGGLNKPYLIIGENKDENFKH